MPKNSDISKKNFKKLEKVLDSMWVNIIKDLSIRYNINQTDLEKITEEKEDVVEDVTEEL